MDVKKIETSKSTKTFPHFGVENEALVHSLNELLANEFALFTRTLNYHWNITGPRFRQIHKFLDEQYHKLLELMDELAERVRVLGARPLSTITEVSHEMSIHEKPGRFPDTDGMLRDLARDHEKIITQMKKYLSTEEYFSQDPVTEDFLIQWLKEHELMRWMIKSHFTAGEAMSGTAAETMLGGESDRLSTDTRAN